MECNMLALRNQNIMAGTDLVVLHKEKSGQTSEGDENTVYGMVRRATRFGSYFGHVSRTEERKVFSKSLPDLTRMERTWESLSRGADTRDSSAKAFSNLHLTESKIAEEAGRRVAHLLMLHAWRRRRLAAERSLILVSELDNQVENLNMQVYALRQILENEKTRRDLAVQELQTKTLECERERNAILKENETLKRRLKEVLNSVMELKVESETQRNYFVAAKAEAETWESRYAKEKKISKALEDRNVVLEEQNRAKDEKIMYQNQNLTELNRRKIELEEELDSYIGLLNGTVDQINSLKEKLKLSEELGQERERFLIGKDEDINRLRAQIEVMEAKFREQDERNGELGKLISDKTKELVLLQDKLGELTKNQRFWGNRAIKMASICTRIPIACFYTVATLLLPHPSYRSM